VPKRKVRRAVAGAAVAGAAVGVAAAASQELAAKVQAIQSRYEGMAAQAQLSGIYDAIGDIDSLLTELPFAVEELRDRGYVHSRQMEDKLAALAAQWDETRPRVESTLEAQVQRLDRDLTRAETRVALINPRNPASIRAADTAVNSLSSQINAARSAVTGLYDGIQQELQSIKWEIGKIETMLALFDESPTLQLLEAEGPLLAVKTVWRRDGDDGPEGVLFLTDQRLLFEQRE
jgi:chromosome segregation ATPase